MDRIKKMLLIFTANTLVMLVSWAGLSLTLLGVRDFTSPQAALTKILSIHTHIAVMFCYAFFMVFDLFEYLSTQSRFGKMKGQMSEQLRTGHPESKLLLVLVLTRVVKVMAACLLLTVIIWLLWLGKYTLGSFLAGAALGLLVFLILSFLRSHLGEHQIKQSSSLTEGAEKLNESEQIRPKAPVED